MVVTVVVLALVAGFPLADANVPAADRAKAVLGTFADALKKKDLDAALKLAQPLRKPVTPDELERKIAGLSRDLSRDGASWTSHETRVDGTVALIVLEQKKSKDAKPDFDPFLLIEREGQFKVLLDDPQEHGLTAEELKSSEKLLAWYEADEERLEKRK